MINVRFAPSPTGMLHIGGARTALLNHLFADAMGGQMHVRIEDTDRERSSDVARDAIIDGLRWLGVLPDTKVVLQSDNCQLHRDAAQALLAKGAAYYCYETPETLQNKRELAEKKGGKYFYDRVWRDKSPQDAPPDIVPAIRLKAPLTGATMINDWVQGKVEISNSQLDDFVIMRGDQSPTYLLSCVVDDINMQISHVIRGDDHLVNGLRQSHIFKMLGSKIPEFAHIPLLHGADGKKFSKRHGASAIIEYQKMGYLPKALVNYLLRLGWGKGDDEKISLEEATKIFQLKDVSKAAARFDFAKLNYFNSLYLREMDPQILLPLLQDFLPEEDRMIDLTDSAFAKGLSGLCLRGDTLVEIAQKGDFYFHAPPLPPKDLKAAKALQIEHAPAILQALYQAFSAVEHSESTSSNNIQPQPQWQGEILHDVIGKVSEKLELGFGKVAQSLRAALTGSMASPDLTEILCVLGKKTVLERIALAQKFTKVS